MHGCGNPTLRQRRLWQEYLAGAQRSYRRHGIESAIDVDAIRRSRDTTLFWTMLDGTGTVIGGIRAVGPLTSPDESHAVVEWAGHPSLRSVRKMIADRIPFGVVEMKSAWVTDDVDRSHRLTASLARTGCQVLAVLGVQPRDRRATRAGALAIVGRRRGSDTLDALSRRTLPHQGVVVGQPHRRDPRRTQSDRHDHRRDGGHP
jgi:hypothetical protein